MTTNAPDEHPIRPCGSIADPYRDLLAQLDDGRRQGMIRRLSVGFYEGWQPSRTELSILVDFELGRISETEFFRARAQTHPAAPTGGPATGTVLSLAGDRVAVGGMQQPNRAAGPLGQAGGESGRGAPFDVDCGELAASFRFVANRLRGAGWSVRGDKSYRLIFLEYQLLPAVSADRWPGGAVRPIPFDAPILCVPDVSAPWSTGDGRSARHVVGPQGISGSRGPWPVAEGVRRIKFVISRQPAARTRSASSPAGVLVIDTATGRAGWNPVNNRRVQQLAAQRANRPAEKSAAAGRR